jgi:hypothetical protein
MTTLFAHDEFGKPRSVSIRPMAWIIYDDIEPPHP